MRIAITFTGRVQGVGFRATVRDLARDLHLVGFVRNEPDGSVYLEAQGQESLLEQLTHQVTAARSSFIHSSSQVILPESSTETSFRIDR